MKDRELFDAKRDAHSGDGGIQKWYRFQHGAIFGWMRLLKVGTKIGTPVAISKEAISIMFWLAL